MPDLRPTIRFGVMCDSTSLDAWQARCIEELLAIPGVELALVIGNHGRTTDTYQTPLRGKLSQLAERVRRGWLLWTAFYLLWVKRRAKSLWPVDMATRFAGVPVINCRVELRGRFSEHFLPEDVGRVREHQLDFILRFGFNIIRGDILTSARFGVWSYHHDDPSAYRGRPAGFWEVFNSDPCTGCVLQHLTDALDGGHMLRRGLYGTRAGYAANLDAILTASSSFAAHVCRELMQTGIEPSSAGPPPSPTIVHLPSDAQMLTFLARAGVRALIRLRQRLHVRQWTVGLLHRRADELINGTCAIGADVTWLEPPAAGFIADPFIVSGDPHGVDLLVERYEFSKAAGTIAALRVDRAGRIETTTPVFTEPWHLSYPQVTRVGDTLWCVPEAATSRKVTGYRYDTDAARWVGQTLVADVRAIDPTMVWHQDRWWLFYTDWRIGDVENLCLAWSRDFSGPWTMHPRNPVKLDVRSSRPGGPLFVVDGQLYRPAQDCSRTYGGAISVSRILQLDELRFEEEVVARLEPAPGSARPAGLHTLTISGSYIAIDGLRERFAPWLKLREYLAERRR